MKQHVPISFPGHERGEHLEGLPLPQRLAHVVPYKLVHLSVHGNLSHERVTTVTCVCSNT